MLGRNGPSDVKLVCFSTFIKIFILSAEMILNIILYLTQVVIKKKKKKSEA